MNWPINFGGLSGGNQPLSDFDIMFQQVAQISTIPCSATGTNAISLTPLTNNPALTFYSELCSFRFRATGNASGPVTAQHNGLGFLIVYHADGVTQANVGDILTGQEYVLTFSQSLTSGAGGFFLEAPAVQNTQSNYYTPGGRLTFVSAVPVMTSSQATPQNVFYAPYVHPFVPIYNGANVQMYQFTSGLSDQVGLTLAMGGSASWPTNTMFDVYVTLVAGVPTLCTVAWTNDTTRATTLAIFGGFLTNAGVATARTTASTTITLAVNQGTFLGSFRTFANGQSEYIFGSAASGGGAAVFGLCNYYNKVLVNTIVTDNGVTYTYTSATVRQARASVNNAIVYIQAASDNAALFNYVAAYDTVVAVGALGNLGMGVNSTTVFSSFVTSSDAASVGGYLARLAAPLSISSTGLTQVNALESGDGTNANVFDFGSQNQLFGSIWL